MTKAVELRGITKKFGTVVANDKVNLTINKGEVLALVGENGAGKSTLMNILYGLHMPNEGEILVNGEQVSLSNALDAIKIGIGMVHQHFMLIPRMSVVENIVLGVETKKGFFFDRAAALEKASEVCEKFKLSVDLNAKISDISLGMQQRVEIIKILYRGADIIILDEPTAVLTPQEIKELGEILAHLKSMGKTIVIITHKMDEILGFSDRVTVLRQGKNAGDLITANTDEREITRLMVGKDVQLGGHKEDVAFDEVALEIEKLTLTDGGEHLIKDISLTVKRGEILGIAGIDGSGQTQLLEVLAGVRSGALGKVSYFGNDINSLKIRERKELGISFVPRDRHKDGLVLDMTVEENLVLGFQKKEKFLKSKNTMNFKTISEHAKDKIETFDIRCSSEKQLAGTLSGGNQQKIIIAREIDDNTKLILADQPTRGIDIGAIEFIHNILTKKRSDGCSVILTSLELDEVMSLSDRIVVMNGGRIVSILDAATATRDEIGRLMVSTAGGHNE